MERVRSLFLGIGAALISAFLVLGSFSIAFTEGGLVNLASLQLTASLVPGPTRIIPLTSVPLLELTATPVVERTELPPALASATPACPVPEGWIQINVMPGDTLESLAETYGTTAEQLKKDNCLISDIVYGGSILNVPYQATPTFIPTSTRTCSPQLGWVGYIVQPGDTLSSIGLKVGVTADVLMFGNCLGSSKIYAGQLLLVPQLPVSSRTPTPTLLSTATSPVPTASYTQTPTLPPTFTQVVQATATPTPSLTLAPTNTVTPTATATMTPSPTFTATPTHTPTLTLTPEPTLTPTDSGPVVP